MHPSPATWCRDCGIPRGCKDTFVPTRTLYFFSKFWSIPNVLGSLFPVFSLEATLYRHSTWASGCVGYGSHHLCQVCPRYPRTHALPVFVPHMSLISSFKQSVHQVPSSSCSGDFQTGLQRRSLKCVAILPSVGSSMGSPDMSHYPYRGMWAVLEILVFLRGTC